jgi:hypothetical protein
LAPNKTFKLKKIMEYKVVPFVASIDRKIGNSNHVAQQLETIIKDHAKSDWIYVGLESVTTFVQPNPGCFGLGAQAGYTTSNQMVVFKK